MRLFRKQTRNPCSVWENHLPPCAGSRSARRTWHRGASLLRRDSATKQSDRSMIALLRSGWPIATVVGARGASVEMKAAATMGTSGVLNQTAGYRNAIRAAPWSWNQRSPARSATAVSESTRPAARLNQRPKCRTVSTQASRFKPSRCKIGDSRAGGSSGDRSWARTKSGGPEIGLA